MGGVFEASDSGKAFSRGGSKESSKEDPLEVINLWSGYIKDSDTASSWLTGARPPYEGRFVIRTNYSTTLTNVQQNIKVYVGGKMADYTVTPVYEDIFNVWSSHVEFDKAAGITNTLIMTRLPAALIPGL